MKLRVILFAAVMVFACWVAAPQAQAQPTIKQGDGVTTYFPSPIGGADFKQQCTLGYIDHNTRVAYYAGHCSHGHSGTAVHNLHGEKVGTVIYNDYPKWGGLIEGIFALHGITSDRAAVAIDPGVAIGANNHSGDRRVINSCAMIYHMLQ